MPNKWHEKTARTHTDGILACDVVQTLHRRAQELNNAWGRARVSEPGARTSPDGERRGGEHEPTKEYDTKGIELSGNVSTSHAELA